MRSTVVLAVSGVAALALAGCSSGSSSAAGAGGGSTSSAAGTTSASSAPAAGSSSATAGSSTAAGSSAATGSSAAASTVAAPSKPSKSYKLTFVQGVKGDPFYATMQCGVESEAKKLGATVQTTGGNKWDATVQIPVVTSVTAQHPDAVLIAPNDTKALEAPLSQLVGAGIKLVLVDTGLDDNSKASSFITSDNLAGGKIAADTLGGMIGGKGTVFVQNVQPGISTTDARAKGFNDEMKAKFPNIKVLPVQYNADDPAKAASITTSQLSAHPDLAGIFATNVQGAEGTATGLKQAGTTKVKVIGFDAGAQQINDLKSGVVQGLVAQDPYTIGVDGVDQAIAALSGQPTTAKIQTNLVAITKDNLAANAKYEYKTTCS
jgi:ribose transport system substrate-binding protein